MDKGKLHLFSDSAILQGAFVLADKLCRPSTLSSIQKADWSRAGQPVLEALKEIGVNPTTEGTWTKKLVCVLWLKLWCKEDGENIEMAWRENPFFSLQSGLPSINHVVLFEIVKSLAAAQTFSRFLLLLSPSQTCTELTKLVEHVKSSPTTEGDIQFFLDVWWELWKCRVEEKKGDDTETMFVKQIECLTPTSSGLSPNAKRLKLDVADETTSLPTPDVLHCLLHALKDIQDHVSSEDLCLQALSTSLDALYTCFLVDRAVPLPPEARVQILSKVASIKGGDERKLDAELIKEAQRDLQASHALSPFQPVMTLRDALNIVTTSARFWESRGLLGVSVSSQPSLAAFKLEQSTNRVLTALSGAKVGAESEGKELQRLLESLSFPAVDCAPELTARVAAIYISQRLDGYQDMAALFAGEDSWAASEELWMECVEKNQAAFQQRDALKRLSLTLVNLLTGENVNVNRCRKLMKVTADVFSALPLKSKNRALADMVALSSRGFFGTASPPSLSDKFEQELNMAFNCIIQGGGGASPGATQRNLDTAVSLVARVAYQNPEAALRSCCHSAVFNKDAFTLMANILQQLPGLGGQQEGEAESRGGLLSACLQETIRAKSLSPNEKLQLLKFVELLMKPVRVDEDEERSFLPPREVVYSFVLPYLSPLGADIELALQLLGAALSAEAPPDVSPHWVMECSPFPLLYVLSQLLNQTLRFWEQPPQDAVFECSMETKELLVEVLTSLGTLVGAEVAAAPGSWSRALSWLYSRIEELDWTVRFHLKPVLGEHFKNEVPSSLLTVCDLPEQEWCGLDLPQYGQGTGLLAWMECCAVSDSLQSTMTSHLSVDQQQVDHVLLFSKGLLLALTQTLPWCSLSQWARLLRVLRELIGAGCLYVPFSLEYVEYLPLLDLRRFACELRLSVFMLRAFQLLCGSSCSHWLSLDGWAHVGRLYSRAVREMLNLVTAKLPLPRDPENSSVQEVLFVLSQLFCHVQHVQAMMPEGQCEPLFLSSLEILSHYEATMARFPESSSPFESATTRHFFTTITDNLENAEMKAVLQQKISQL
uniref:Gem (nuclear organelle) associated protein 4 n=1 Tax=Tetraodon nigroviridis TaxID=99883 RepID=H3D9V5_TETNG